MRVSDKRIGQVLSLLASGGVAFAAPPTAPVTLGLGAGTALALQFLENKNALSVIKYVLFALTVIVSLFVIVAVLGLWALWQVLS